MICIILLLRLKMEESVIDKNKNKENVYINFDDFILPNQSISIGSRETT